MAEAKNSSRAIQAPADCMSRDDLNTLAALREEFSRAQVALESVERLYVSKYRLTPGDTVADDGQIVRAAQPQQQVVVDQLVDPIDRSVSQRASDDKPRFPSFPFQSLTSTGVTTGTANGTND